MGFLFFVFFCLCLFHVVSFGGGEDRSQDGVQGRVEGEEGCMVPDLYNP